MLGLLGATGGGGGVGGESSFHGLFDVVKRPEVCVACCARARGSRQSGRRCASDARRKIKVTHKNIALKGNCFNEMMCQVGFI